MKPIIKTTDEIKGIKKACVLASKTLDFITPRIIPGVTTAELDRLAHEFIVTHGAIPAPLNYKGYPKSTCISVNDVICHGIPSEEVVLKEGDIVNVDVTVILDGFFGDTSRMFCVGGVKAVSEMARRLVEVTERALYEGLAVIRAGAYVNDVGVAIESYVESTGHGFQIVREFTGHGIGIQFHEPPQVPHYNLGKLGTRLESGMILTVEPMINVGTWRSKIDPDGWTARTADGSLSAQWEHTVLVLPSGCEILTVM